jgi:hypothetical protein
VSSLEFHQSTTLGIADELTYFAAASLVASRDNPVKQRGKLAVEPR